MGDESIEPEDLTWNPVRTDGVGNWYPMVEAEPRLGEPMPEGLFIDTTFLKEVMLVDTEDDLEPKMIIRRTLGQIAFEEWVRTKHNGKKWEGQPKKIKRRWEWVAQSILNEVVIRLVTME